MHYYKSNSHGLKFVYNVLTKQIKNKQHFPSSHLSSQNQNKIRACGILLIQLFRRTNGWPNLLTHKQVHV